MTAERSLVALALASTLAIFGSCKELHDVEQSDPIPLGEDLRTYARDARANMSRLPASYQAAVAPMLGEHERALARFDRVMAQGQTRRALQAPLLVTSASLLFDDATGVGVANDIALPFLALGFVAAAIATTPPASRKTKRQAYADVVDSAQSVSNVMEATTRFMTSQQVTSVPGERQFCIDMYVACQLEGRRSFPRSRCQPCMDQCTGQGFKWPKANGCKFWK